MTFDDHASVRPETGPGFGPRRHYLLAAGWLVLSASVAWIAVLRKTPTIDEFQHLPTGCLILRSGEFFMHRKSPPLARVWCALPVALATDVEVPTENVWRGQGTGWGPWIYATAFHLRNPQVYDRCFALGRFMNLFWLLPLGLILFRWTSLLFGRRAGWLAIVLLGTSPTVLAHAPLVTTDLSAATAFFIAMYLFWETGRRKRPLWFSVGTGLVLGVGLLCKFTLVLLPLFWSAILAAHGCVVRGREQRNRDRNGTTENAQSNLNHLRRMTVIVVWRLILPGIVAGCVVQAGYGFRQLTTRLKDMPTHSRTLTAIAASPFGRIPLPLPRDFLAGLDEQKTDAEHAEFPAYLFGHWSRNGWWYYYPAAFLGKTPVALTVLLLLAFGTWRPRFPGQNWWTVLCVAVPVMGLGFVLCFANRLDIGVRYLLPIFPFLYLVIGRLVRQWHSQPRLRRVLALLTAAYVMSSALQYPDYLAYFNEAVGGPGNGHRLLLDSNLDWGQDLAGLARYTGTHGIDRIKLAYFGHVWPQHYGLKYELLGHKPEPGYIAASVAFVQGQPYVLTYAGDAFVPVPENAYTWLQNYQPIARVGRSIWIYHITTADLQ